MPAEGPEAEQTVCVPRKESSWHLRLRFREESLLGPTVSLSQLGVLKPWRPRYKEPESLPKL